MSSSIFCRQGLEALKSPSRKFGSSSPAIQERRSQLESGGAPNSSRGFDGFGFCFLLPLGMCFIFFLVVLFLWLPLEKKGEAVKAGFQGIFLFVFLFFLAIFLALLSTWALKGSWMFLFEFLPFSISQLGGGGGLRMFKMHEERSSWMLVHVWSCEQSDVSSHLHDPTRLN